MPDFLLGVDFDWSKANTHTEQFIENVRSEIARLGQLTLPSAGDQRISMEQFAGAARGVSEQFRSMVKEALRLKQITTETAVNLNRGVNSRTGGVVYSEVKNVLGSQSRNNPAAGPAWQRFHEPEQGVLDLRGVAQRQALEKEAQEIARARNERLQQELRVLDQLAAEDRKILEGRRQGEKLQQRTNIELQGDLAIQRHTAAAAVARHQNAYRGTPIGQELTTTEGQNAAGERLTAVRKQVAYENQLATYGATYVNLAADEAKFRRARVAAERAASTTFGPSAEDQTLRSSIIANEARAGINERTMQASIKARQSQEFSDPKNIQAQFTLAQEANTALQERIIQIRKNLLIESGMQKYLVANAESVAQEAILRRRNAATVGRHETAFLSGDSGEAVALRNDEAAIAAGGRVAELKKNVEIERLMGRDLVVNAALVKEEAQLRRLRIATEQAAVHDFRGDPALGASIASKEAQANIGRRTQDAARNRIESGYFSSTEGQQLTTTEGENAAAERLTAVHRSLAEETKYAQLLATNSHVLGEEASVRAANVAAQRRITAEAQAGIGGEDNRQRAQETLNAELATARAKAISAQSRTGDPRFAEADATSTLAREKGVLQRRYIVAARSLDRAVQEEVLLGDRIKLTANVNHMEKELASKVRAEQREVSSAGGGRGSIFQRLYARSKGAGEGGGVDPLEAPTLGKFLGSRLITSAGYGLSGGLLYGGLSQVKEMVTEATELQRALAVVQGAFESLSKEIDGFDGAAKFKEFREEALKISDVTATKATETVNIMRQLQGSFADDQGVPDVGRAGVETEAALKLSQLTGLPQQEITDSLTAVALSFHTNFTAISDSILGLQQRFGVLAPDIIKFTADLAPLGAELGFSFEQLSGLSAVAQQASGKSGEVLGSEFARILPGLRERQADIAKLFGQNPATQDVVAPMLEAFSQGDVEKALELIVGSYSKLSEAQKNSLANVVGERRGASAFFAVLERGPQLLEALGASQNKYAGTTATQFGILQQTVGFKMQKLERAIEEFGHSLYEAGLGDLLKQLADSAIDLVKTGGAFVEFFSGLNDAMGGSLKTILELVAGLYAVNRAMALVGSGAGQKALGAISGIAASGLGAGVFQAGGALSAWTAGAGGQKVLRSSLMNRYPGPTAMEGLATGTGGGAGGLLAGAAPMLSVAALLGAGLYYAHSRTSTQEKNEAGQDKIAKIIEDEIQKGTSKEVLQSRVDQLKSSDQGSYSFFQKAGNFVLGADTTDPGDVAQRKLDQAEVARDRVRYEQGIDGKAPLKTGADALRVAIEAAKASGDLGAFQPRYEYQAPSVGPTGSMSGGGVSVTSSYNVADEDLLVLKRYSEDPGKKENVDAYNALLASIKGTSYEKIVQDAEAKYQLQQKMTEQQKLANETTIPQLTAAAAAYKSGQGSLKDYEKALDDDIALQQQMVDDAKLSGVTNEAAATALAGDFEQKYAIARKAADEMSKRDTQVATLGGTLDPQRQVEISRGRYEALANDPTSGIDDVTAASEDLAQAEQAAFERQVADADTAAEQLALLNKGFTYSPEAMASITASFEKVFLNSDEGKADLAGPAEVLGLSLDELTKTIGDQVTRTGESAKTILVSLLKARQAWLIQVSENSGLPDPDNPYLAEISNIDAQIAAVDAAMPEKTPPIPGTVTDEERRTKQAEKNTRTEAKAMRDARRNLANAEAGDNPRDVAKRAIQAAEDAENLARANGDEPGAINAAADKVRAIRQSHEADSAVSVAWRNLATAQSGDDARNVADDVIAAADLAGEVARAAGDDAGVVNAAADKIRGLRQRRKADTDLRDAWRNLFSAGMHDDPVQVALAAQQTAQEAVDNAVNDADRLNAAAEKIRADRSVAQAMRDLTDAQIDLLIAFDQYHGDTVDAAEKQLQKLQATLANSDALGLTDQQKVGLATAIQSQKGVVRDAKESDQQALIDYQLEMGEITKGQAIAMLEGMRSLVSDNDDKTRALNLQIKRLKGELSQDFKFNLPERLAVPTIYEVRRLSQTNRSGGGYNDNRVVSVTVNAQSGASAQDIAREVNNVVGQPNRVGQRSGLY